jgi:hypothetical protein
MACNLSIVSSKIRNSQYIITNHAGQRRKQRRIPINNLVNAIGYDNPKIIQNNNHGCLILGWDQPNSPLHAYIAVSKKDSVHGKIIIHQSVRVVTLYRPNPLLWKAGYEKYSWFYKFVFKPAKIVYRRFIQKRLRGIRERIGKIF